MLKNEEREVVREEASVKPTMKVCESVNGVIFLKSRKSVTKIVGNCQEIMRAANKNNINVIDFVMDDSSAADVDRPEIDELMKWIEKDFIKVVLLNSIYDLTRDIDDLERFVRIAHENDVVFYSMEWGCVVKLREDDGAGC